MAVLKERVNTRSVRVPTANYSHALHRRVLIRHR